MVFRRDPVNMHLIKPIGVAGVQAGVVLRVHSQAVKHVAVCRVGRVLPQRRELGARGCGGRGALRIAEEPVPETVAVGACVVLVKLCGWTRQGIRG